MRQPSFFRWIIVLTALALLSLGSSAGAQRPGLIAAHFPLPLSLARAFARADEAIRAANLNPDSPTTLSRGGHNDFLTVLIHCIENGKTTLVDLEVANNGHVDEAVAMRVFLAEFMKAGKAPVGKGFSGAWETSAGGSYKMTLLQQGNRVTGTYGNGGTKGTLEGTVEGNTLRFHWTQTNGNKGAGRFILSTDGKAFNGFWTYDDDPEKADKAWNGKRIGAAPQIEEGRSDKPDTITDTGRGSFAGEWDTVSGAGTSYKMTLVQHGNRVTGTYGRMKGTLDGTVDGNILRFRWTETSGSKGTGRFILSADGRAFNGFWTNGDDPDKADRIWNGKRASDAPQSGDGGSGDVVHRRTAGGSDPRDPITVAVAKGPAKIAVNYEYIEYPKPPLPPRGADLLDKGQHGDMPLSEANKRVRIISLKLSREAEEDRPYRPGTLRVDIKLSGPLDPNGRVDLYVGGYVYINRDTARFYDAYKVERWIPQSDADLETTLRFQMPDVLPAQVRAEIADGTSDKIGNVREQVFDYPFPELHIAKGMLLYQDEKHDAVGGVLIQLNHDEFPDGSKIIFDFVIPNKNPGEPGLLLHDVKDGFHTALGYTTESATAPENGWPLSPDYSQEHQFSKIWCEGPKGLEVAVHDGRQLLQFWRAPEHGYVRGQLVNWNNRDDRP